MPLVTQAPSSIVSAHVHNTMGPDYSPLRRGFDVNNADGRACVMSLLPVETQAASSSGARRRVRAGDGCMSWGECKSATCAHRVHQGALKTDPKGGHRREQPRDRFPATVQTLLAVSL